jgi:Na+/H+ antiporter NhaC
MSFLSENYDRPKLVENKLIKKIIIEQKNNITIVDKFKINIFEFIKENYKVIGIVMIVLILLYWRYHETKQKKLNNKADAENTEDVEFY